MRSSLPPLSRLARLGLLAVLLPSGMTAVALAGAGQSLTGAPLPDWFRTYDAEYQVRVEQGTVPMPDGVSLSATFYKPMPKVEGERFPVVLEMLPYRKDDSFYARDYAIYTYLAERGIAGVRVDIRGTGGSEGRVPDREYSDAELADLEETIAALAALPWSNGNVGMQGISWSAFNALMMTMRSPPALKAILVLHGSEDLYANDVHNIDGALHLDIFTQEMETANIIPRPPQYPVDDAYFRDRFDTEPWVIAYLRHQRDGPFWRDRRSLSTAYDQVKIPIYAIGALLDGYRDYVIAILNHVKSPVRAEIGPWNHAFPDSGEPGPNYDFKQSAVRWWKRWLADEDSGIMREPKYTVFLRDAIPASDDYAVTPGEFRSFDWPLAGSDPQTVHLAASGALEASAVPPARLSLDYRPASGIAAGSWWGERTIAMPEAEPGTLVFTSEPYAAKRYLVGQPVAELTVSADAPEANWVVRLEDRHPDGTVSLITGGIANGTQRLSRTDPSPIPPGERFVLRVPMRFTTYTLEPGHCLRVVVSNAQFPMIWPTPYAMTTTLYVGDGASTVTLPLVDSIGTPADFLLAVPPGGEAAPDDFADLGGALGPAPLPVVSREGSIVHARQSEDESFRIGEAIFSDREAVDYSVDESAPANAAFESEGEATIELAGRTIAVATWVAVRSDASAFHIEVRRKVSENRTVLRERTWSDVIPRDLQ
jgi:putative CocE/NonD family hydrolase